jgi:multiple sugar transport system ATP-binding protein
MKDGFIRQIGTPQEVFNRPADLFVAGFIGAPQMNFFDAELTLDENVYRVKADGVPLDLPPGKQEALRAAGAVPCGITLGVRPEHITLCDENAQGGSFDATVEVSEMMGTFIHLHTKTTGGDNAVLVLPTIGLPEEKQGGFRMGDRIRFTFGGNVMHLFAKSDERNLIP